MIEIRLPYLGLLKYENYKKDQDLPEGERYYLGDMHANTLYFIHFLVKIGVIVNFTEDQFDKIVDIYTREGFTGVWTKPRSNTCP